MGKKLNFAIIAMLGFSAACSTSKRTQTSPENDETQTDVPAVIEPRIKVMYGVRSPRPISMPDEAQPETAAGNQGDTADSTDTPDTTDNAQKSE